MTTRPPAPESVVQWRKQMHALPPKCCHTCDKFSESGNCQEFDMRPPDDFASTVDACEQWAEMIPF